MWFSHFIYLCLNPPNTLQLLSSICPACRVLPALTLSCPSCFCCCLSMAPVGPKDAAPCSKPSLCSSRFPYKAQALNHSPETRRLPLSHFSSTLRCAVTISGTGVLSLGGKQLSSPCSKLCSSVNLSRKAAPGTFCRACPKLFCTEYFCFLPRFFFFFGQSEVFSQWVSVSRRRCWASWW